MIYITGDTHGDFKRFSKFNKVHFKRRDFLIVCGDFGFVWDNSAKEWANLKKFLKLRCCVLFIEGTHDNLGALSQFPKKEMWGGEVRELTENLFWLQRGNVFNIEGKKIFAMGGGQSVDADERIKGISWWPEEMPTHEELMAAEENLYRNDYEVDYIISHQNPHGNSIILDSTASKTNPLSTFLSKVSRNVKFDHWYFGGEHMDKTISSKMTAVFEKIYTIKTDTK
ncbi:MAG: metallophosphoesterase [Oscillospiraceae bacterium]